MDILKELPFLKANQVATDAENLLEYGRDWTRYYTPNPKAILFPSTTEEVQKIVQWARKNKIAIVPSGGRTGLSGAAVAKNGEVVLSLQRMNKILDFNEIDQTLTCEAGCLTEEAQDYATSKGAHFPVDFAARGSSQIGGNVATNVGGLNVVRYGLMREWVSGLTVVTGAGEILKLNNGLVKNNTGYDLRHLFIGSEGTLGIITEVVLRVTTPPKETSVVIVGLEDHQFVSKVYQKFRNAMSLTAFEMFTQDAVQYVLKSHPELSPPLGQKFPIYLLIEAETDSEEKMQKLLTCFEEGVEAGFIQDGVISQSEQQAENFWKYRDYISESLSPHTPYKNDISVKISDVTTFVKETDDLLKKEYPQFKVVWFGHIGDGNLHVNILKPSELSMDEFVKGCQKVDQLLFKNLKKFGGSVSAEHGVGLSKKPFLHFTKSEAEIEIMKQIKKVFDPDLILNPGKIFDI
ncbi:MAG: FAD-binding oxidoreductase [Bdellovibrionota bacterium]